MDSFTELCANPLDGPSIIPERVLDYLRLLNVAEKLLTWHMMISDLGIHLSLHWDPPPPELNHLSVDTEKTRILRTTQLESLDQDYPPPMQWDYNSENYDCVPDKAAAFSSKRTPATDPLTVNSPKKMEAGLVDASSSSGKSGNQAPQEPSAPKDRRYFSRITNRSGSQPQPEEKKLFASLRLPRTPAQRDKRSLSPQPRGEPGQVGAPPNTLNPDPSTIQRSESLDDLASKDKKKRGFVGKVKGLRLRRKRQTQPSSELETRSECKSPSISSGEIITDTFDTTLTDPTYLDCLQNDAVIAEGYLGDRFSALNVSGQYRIQPLAGSACTPMSNESSGSSTNQSATEEHLSPRDDLSKSTGGSPQGADVLSHHDEDTTCMADDPRGSKYIINMSCSQENFSVLESLSSKQPPDGPLPFKLLRDGSIIPVKIVDSCDVPSPRESPRTASPLPQSLKGASLTGGDSPSPSHLPYSNSSSHLVVKQPRGHSRNTSSESTSSTRTFIEKPGVKSNLWGL